MPELSVVVAWKDASAQALQGVVEISESDLVEAQQRQPLPSAAIQVGDLIQALGKKLERSAAEKENGIRLVDSLLLYGTELDSDRPLQSVLPDASDCCPRILAKTRFASKSSVGLLIIVKFLTGKAAYLDCVPSDFVGNVKQKSTTRVDFGQKSSLRYRVLEKVLMLKTQAETRKCVCNVFRAMPVHNLCGFIRYEAADGMRTARRHKQKINLS
ncbi:hypothetical protein PHYPSEUDO_004297 [Phytophthora pseudosyringae]|uniref:Uncharacterized protein n=1 Tax=Phytophthora pseudosyringae TaxID=221518 RepID=A0A8T1VPI7_9STRA|nr:hypothetical protein PHYPSEUDO_004297 [Phytophthora pseudosyringae]